MTFIRLLQGIGDRLGILESVQTRESGPARKIQTRTVSLRELACEIRSGEVEALADSPSELTIPFDKIFDAAGVSAKPEEWTIERLKQVISSETAKYEAREAVQTAILEILKSEGVAVETLVKDAMARDQALDSFENRVSEKMQERRQTCKHRLLDLENQIQDLREQTRKLESGLKADEEKWREWRRCKRAHERELASLAGYIVDHPVITTDEEE
jgi:hypothetical protein